MVVRAPLRLSEDKIDRFVREHLDWIEKQKDRIQELSGKRHVITGTGEGRRDSEGIEDFSGEDSVFC